MISNVCYNEAHLSSGTWPAWRASENGATENGGHNPGINSPTGLRVETKAVLIKNNCTLSLSHRVTNHVLGYLIP